MEKVNPSHSHPNRPDPSRELVAGSEATSAAAERAIPNLPDKHEPWSFTRQVTVTNDPRISEVAQKAFPKTLGK